MCFGSTTLLIHTCFDQLPEPHMLLPLVKRIYYSLYMISLPLMLLFIYGHHFAGLTRRLSNASSLGSMEESFYLQASLDSSDTLSERRNPGEPTMSSYYIKSMTPNVFEAALRQKEGELASYMSRLVWIEILNHS